MQYISFDATRIATPDTAHRPAMPPAFDPGAEQTQPALPLRVRFYRDTQTPDGGFQVFYDEPVEEYAAVEEKDKGWRLVADWTGAIVASWALVIGCVVLARALLR